MNDVPLFDVPLFAADKGRGAVIMTNGAQGELRVIEILAAVSSVYDWGAKCPISKLLEAREGA